MDERRMSSHRKPIRQAFAVRKLSAMLLALVALGAHYSAASNAAGLLPNPTDFAAREPIILSEPGAGNLH